MTKYEGQKLTNAAFVVEECFFVNCVLTDCDLFYSGGDAEWANTSFPNCRWHWQGPAGRTLNLMRLLGILKPQEIPPQNQASSSKLMN
jgi:hypothetical protein